MSVVKNKKVESNMRRRKSRGEQTPANWLDVNSHAIGTFCATLAEHGFAVRIGKSRDGGSYAIGIYGDGDPYTEYARPSDNILELMDEIATDLTGIDLLLEKTGL